MNKVRFDESKHVVLGYVAVWLLHIPEADPRFDEFGVMLYGLGVANGAARKRPDMTHEVIVCSLSPNKKVDFDRPAFEQRKLEPLSPPNHAFQFQAESHDAARSRVQVCVNSLLTGTLLPEEDGADAWSMLFADGMNLLKP